MAERGKEERAEQLAKLDSIIQKHEVNNILKYHLSMIYDYNKIDTLFIFF